MLDIKHARNRQKRLLDAVADRRLDAIVIGATPLVQYITGHLPFWLHQVAAVLFTDGRMLLAPANKEPEHAAADEVTPFEANRFSTRRSDVPAAAAEKVLEALKSRKAKRIGFDASAVSSQVIARFDGEAEPVDDEIIEMRRRKDPDELAMMKKAIECTVAMHTHARRIMEPGIPELRVFGELHRVAVEAAGEPLTTRLGNDYACGARGGPPRGGRVAAAGELYILDLGPCYRGYFADNCRTYSVDRMPTDLQLQAWQRCADVFATIERMARPGARCREIFDAVNEHFRSAGGQELTHHLGHGVGLDPQEAPHLNPRWDDVLMEGEVFSAEPGQYAPELAAGVRLENTYLVTNRGVDNLVHVPLELV